MGLLQKGEYYELMCGIAGIIDPRLTQEDLLLMQSYLHERGPDAHATWMENGVGFAHTRLSIIDLSEKANQPMFSEDGQQVIVYNGEIYNFAELKTELISKGLSFKTNSDTEVLLQGFREWGIKELLEKLNGMFAFGLYDKRDQKLFLCRDPFGKKPLYYLEYKNRFLFSSDIRSIYKIEKDLSIDWESVDYYLSELSVPQPKTIWNEVKQLSPGHYLTYELQGIKEELYREAKPLQMHPGSEEEILEELDLNLRAALKRRLVGDVPVGAFLSGGVDSGLLVALLAESQSEKVRTFSVGFSHEEYNELPLAKALAERYETDHTEIIIEADLISALYDLVEYFGEPFADSSMLPTYFISKEIQKHVKVAISGDGGDEIFGGYHDYGWASQADAYKKAFPSPLLRVPVKIVNKVAYKMGLTRHNFGHVEAYIRIPEGMKLYREMGFHPQQKTLLYHKDFAQARPNFAADRLDSIWAANKSGSLYDTLAASSLKTRLLNDYLVKVDRASMMSSLEVRSPFLDKELVSFAAGIPSKLKTKGHLSKYLLKKLAMKYINPDILERPKMGFGIPLDLWLRGELSDLVQDTISSSSFKQRNIFDQVYVDGIIQEHNSKKADHTSRIWALMCLEMWFQKFLDA